MDIIGKNQPLSIYILPLWFLVISSVSHFSIILSRPYLQNPLRLLVLLVIIIFTIKMFILKNSIKNRLPLIHFLLFGWFLAISTISTAISPYDKLGGYIWLAGMSITLSVLFCHIKYINSYAMLKIFRYIAMFGTMYIALLIVGYIKEGFGFNFTLKYGGAITRLGTTAGFGPNTIAEYCTAVLIVSRAFDSKLWRYLLSGIMLFFIMLTWSRTGFSAALIGFVIVDTAIKRKIGSKLILLLMFGLTTVLLWDLFFKDFITNYFIRNRYENISSDTAKQLILGRVGIWALIFSFLKECSLFEILFGFGVSSSGEISHKLAGTGTHNGFVAALLNFGIFGLSCMVFIVMSSSIKLVKKWIRTPKEDTAELTTVAVSMGIIVSTLIIGSTSSTLLNPTNLMGLLFLLSIFWSGTKPVAEEKISSDSPRSL